jgi:hypothetical protein
LQEIVGERFRRRGALEQRVRFGEQRRRVLGTAEVCQVRAHLRQREAEAPRVAQVTVGCDRPLACG